VAAFSGVKFHCLGFAIALEADAALWLKYRQTTHMVLVSSLTILSYTLIIQLRLYYARFAKSFYELGIKTTSFNVPHLI